MLFTGMYKAQKDLKDARENLEKANNAIEELQHQLDYYEHHRQQQLETIEAIELREYKEFYANGNIREENNLLAKEAKRVDSRNLYLFRVNRDLKARLQRRAA